MKKILSCAVFGCLLLLASTLHAQWKTESYLLKAGWNGIWLHGDASHATPDQLFSAYPTVTEVWRWNPNPDQVQFSASPAVPDATSSEWTIWKRGDPDEQQLTKMLGQSAYLVYCTGSAGTTTTVLIPQKPQPPAASWLISGANFLGFPVDPASTTTTFTNYFASFPAAITTPTKIYRYVGGELGLANPMELTSFGSQKVERNTAYWFQAATVGNFTGLVEYETPGNAGLAFGRTAVSLTVGVKNLSSSAVTLTISTRNSEPAPTTPVAQPAITGPVPLTRLVLDSTTGTYNATPIVGSFTVTVPANGRLDLLFGIDRNLLLDPITGNPAGAASLFASLLSIKDSARQTEVFLPVTAQPATPSGLWIGEVSVNSVGRPNAKLSDGTVTDLTAGQSGTTVVRPFPLRLIVHVDAEGVARVLSQAYVGNLATTGHAPGICTHEGGLWADTKSDALRLVSSQMPIHPNEGVFPATGAFAVGHSLTYTVKLDYDDPTNPFVHTYHPDHDNLDARFSTTKLPAGAESYTVTRQITLNFTSAPPDGSTVGGWGTTVYGGTYTETVTGINRKPLTASGDFGLRRISEVATLDTTTK